MSVESHDLGPVPNLTALSGYGDSYVVPGDEVYVVSEDTDYIYLNTGSNPPADGFNIIKAIFLPGVWQRRSSGGGAGALRFNTVAVGALGSGRLIDTSLAGLVDGTSLAWVESVKDTWRWDATSTATADNITVCNPTANGANPGRFIRELIPAPEWMFQTTWVVDVANSSATASDENDGLTAVTPLLTTAERRRRMGPGCIWKANTAYHIRYISGAPVADDVIDGQRETNATIYLHASMNDREGITPPLYSGVVDAYQGLVVATNTPIKLTSNGLAVNWTGLIDQRLRYTSGAAINAVTSPNLQDAVTAKQAWIDETLIPAASLSVAPFVAPASTATAPAVNDTFVIESLRTISRLTINLQNGPGNGSTSTGVVLDSLLITSMLGTGQTGVYCYGSRVSTAFGAHFSFLTWRSCVFSNLGVNDTGLKSIIGGHVAAGGALLLVNNDASNSGIGNFTLQNPSFIAMQGSGGQSSPDTWRPGQIGSWNNTGCPLSFNSNGCRLSASYNLYGSGNTAPAINLVQNVVGICQQGIFTASVFSTSDTAYVQCTHSSTPRKSVPAFDTATNVFTADRLLSKANLEATVAAGGFDYAFVDPVSGAGFVKYGA